MIRRSLLFSIVGVIGMTAGAFLAGRAVAGIPAEAALTYSGVVEDVEGAPLDGEHVIEVKFWAASSGGDAALCTNNGQAVTLEQGRFAVGLPDSCTDAVKLNPELWVEVLVDGSSLGRAKAGAVPFAVEAGHATSADSATNSNNAAHATSADSATNATNAVNADNAAHATSADSATNATNAVNADNAAHATSADSAANATNAVNADNADNAAHATSADTALTADSATSATSATTAANATNAEHATAVAVHRDTINASDGNEDGNQHGAVCIQDPNGQSTRCAVTAGRKCRALGYSVGWFEGESSDGTTRSIVCLQ